MESKDYTWKWVTADEILTKGPCEILYALFIPSSSSTATATIFTGEDATGTTVVAFRTAQSRQSEFKPPKPVYCERGLFVDDIANVKGVFVQWRNLPK